MKKGNFSDIFILILILLGIFIISPIMVVMLNDLSSSVAPSYPEFASNITAGSNAIVTVMDSGFIFLVIIVSVIIIISSVYIFSSPVMFGIGIVVLILALIFSMFASNIAYSIASSPSLNATYDSSFSMSSQVMQNLPYYVGLLFFMIFVILIAKRNTGGTVNV